MCYGYDALNRIRHIRYGNGVETAYTYDGDGNVRTLETRAGKTVLLSFAYRYDGNGNRTAKTGTQATLGGIISGSNVLDISYAYDVRGQLLEERRNGASVCYAYDKAGNRIRKTDVQGEIRYLYNEKNQLIAEESPADRKQFSYDRQGGIIEEKNLAGIRRFSYNSRHQQTRVETETGSVQENRYDAEGLRFELLENGRRTSFVYHDGELLQEEGREEQGTSYHLGAGMEAFRRGQELSYYHRDEQLSTVFVTDGHRNVQNSYQYDAFGMSLGTTEKLNNRIRYTGQQYDDVTGQYYLRARYYNPVAGRFMQEDVYQGDGLNLYAYCGNNPVVYDDPSGYASTSTGKACPPKGKISESVDGSGTPSEKVKVPTVKSGEFNEWFNSLSVDELDELWKDKSTRKAIERQLRAPGGMHEWHLVSRAPQFKYWSVNAEQIRDLRTVINDVEFVNPVGKHGQLGSTTAHNELLGIIDSSSDYSMFTRRLNNWANYRLKGGIDTLPEGLRIK